MLGERFWSKVEKTDGCWLWTRSVNKKGYGKYAVGGSARRWRLAHVVAYEDESGPVPAGMQVMHTCDTKRCVRRSHLELGTNLQNALDAHDRLSRSNYVGLTRAKVASIRASFTGQRGQIKALAAAHGVHRDTISRVIRRETWNEREGHRGS